MSINAADAKSYEFSFCHKIPYKKVRDGHRPILMLNFLYQVDSYEFSMLVDSGADNIVLPESLAELLGIDINSLPRESANTCRHGKITGRRMEELVFFLTAFPHRVFTNRVYFADSRYDFGYGLLGREIFNRIRFCFNNEADDAFYLGFNGGDLSLEEW